jgi:hypothetical protein
MAYEPTLNPQPVSATDLDIRDLTSVTDSVAADITKIGGATLTIGQQLAAASVPVILPSATITTLTPPAAITGFATSAKQDTLLTELQAKADLTETQPVSLASVPSHAVTNAGTFAVQDTTTASTPYQRVSDTSTNAINVKASAGVVYGIFASNVNAAARYLKLYNKASAPTVGTDTPVHTFIIPGNTAGAGTNIPVPDRGIDFGTGISFALTTESTVAGTTGVTANEIVVNLDYT